MSKIVSVLQDFVREEDGQDIIEYGLLAAFIAIVASVLLFQFSTPINAIYTRILEYLNAANNKLPVKPT